LPDKSRQQIFSKNFLKYKTENKFKIKKCLIHTGNNNNKV